MKTIFILILIQLFPSFALGENMNLLCKGEEAKYIEDNPRSKRVAIKSIGIQIYQKGMRLDGEWFESKSDLTEDYLLEKSYLKTNDNIIGTRNFSTNSLIEGRKIKTVKVDNVEINILTNKIYWVHKFKRVDMTDSDANVIYAYRKYFRGTCR